MQFSQTVIVNEKMIRKIKLLLTPLVWLTLLSCNANGQTNDLGRECIDKCVHLNDSSLYSFKLQVVKDSSQENTILKCISQSKLEKNPIINRPILINLIQHPKLNV